MIKYGCKTFRQFPHPDVLEGLYAANGWVLNTNMLNRFGNYFLVFIGTEQSTVLPGMFDEDRNPV